VQGPEGRRGLRGPDGEPGFSALSRLPGGKTESGDFLVSEQAALAGEAVGTAVTFSVPLTTPIVEKIEFAKVGTPSTNCLGVGAAAKGYMCVYTSAEENVEASTGAVSDPEAKEATAGTGAFGAEIAFKAVAAGPVRVAGSYTVTAP
jgi:hypothetical protein